MIKEYFANFYQHSSDVTFELQTNTAHVHRTDSEPWTVTLVDTGDSTETGGRLKRIEPYVAGETFCFTYGDGISDVDITRSWHFTEAKERRQQLPPFDPRHDTELSCLRTTWS